MYGPPMPPPLVPVDEPEPSQALLIEELVTSKLSEQSPSMSYVQPAIAESAKTRGAATMQKRAAMTNVLRILERRNDMTTSFRCQGVNVQ
jgi:hypothetical protein